MRKITLENIIPAVHGDYFGDFAMLGEEVSFITTDSRQAGEGCMFAAIPGERSDGHDFVHDCFHKGALCCLTEREIPNAEGPVIVVRNTQRALQELAAFYRAQFGIPILGITGSVGKTTAKEMTASVLSQRFNTLKTEKNFNNDLGVPLTLFRLRDEHEAAVVEMGISNFGEMRTLTRMVCPEMALFTLIGYSHLENLGDREGVLRAKSEMLEDMDPSGVVFLNGDDNLLREMDCGGRKKVLFGTTQDCQVWAKEYEQFPGGSRCVICSGERAIPVEIKAFGSHLIYAALAAAAVGIELGLSDHEIAAGIAGYAPVGSRSRVVETDYCTVIDDCYNANPNSMASGIASLSDMPGRRVCILGDMLELGAEKESLHYAVGRTAADSGVALVLTCGELSQEISRGAMESETPAMVWHFHDKGELLPLLPKLIRKGDSVLVKASHSMHFEEIVEELKKL